MSFLSRKPSRSDDRESGAGRADEYDDYDYAPDGYADVDDDRSPVEYFSPGGIKSRWADGRSPAERPAPARGRRGDSGAGYDGYADGFDNGHYDGGQDQGQQRNPAGDYPADAYQRDGYSGGYGADEYATGAYDLPEGADEERGSERTGSRWRRRDREDRGERTGILPRLRRDRGEDIWPDDGISDEDYWASVASDRPLTGTNAPSDDDVAPTTGRSGVGPGGGGLGGEAGLGGRGALGAAGGSDLGGSSGGRGSGAGATAGGGAGRLGPAPGLLGYQPAGGSAGSGPMPARQGTGPTPAVGATSSRPVGTTSSRPLGAASARPGGAPNSASWPGTGQGGGATATGSSSGPFAQQPGSRPSFQPNGYPSGGAPAGARRHVDRGDWSDWGEQTERIERVNASGYPDPRPSDSRSADPRSGDPRAADPRAADPRAGDPRAADPRAGDPRAGDPRQGRGAGGGPSRSPSGPFGAVGATGAYGSVGSPGPSARPGPDRGRGDGTDWRSQDRRQPSRDAATRDLSRTSGGWPAAGRGAATARGNADDPLTSPAYSRSALRNTDGRSYQGAARRSQAQPKLTDTNAATFTATGQYPAAQYGTGEYPAAQQQTGQYPAAQAGPHRADPQAPAGRYPGYSPQQDRGQLDRGQLDRGQRQGAGHAPAQGQGQGQGQPEPGRAAQSARPGSGRVSLPGGSTPSTGQYETPQPRPQRPQERPQERPQPPSRPAPPSAGAPGAVGAAGVSGGSGGTPAGGGAAASGLNPYDSAVTGSYPYPTQPYSARSASRVTGGQPQDPADDRYYRPAPSSAKPAADGYGNSADYGRNGSGTGGYGTNGYGVPRGDNRR